MTKIGKALSILAIVFLLVVIIADAEPRRTGTRSLRSQDQQQPPFRQRGTTCPNGPRGVRCRRRQRERRRRKKPTRNVGRTVKPTARSFEETDNQSMLNIFADTFANWSLEYTNYHLRGGRVSNDTRSRKQPRDDRCPTPPSQPTQCSAEYSIDECPIPGQPSLRCKGNMCCFDGCRNACYPAGSGEDSGIEDGYNVRFKPRRNKKKGAKRQTGSCPATRRRRKSSCTNAKPSNCWSPGVPDLDCLDGGMCCFNGCSNRCIESSDDGYSSPGQDQYEELDSDDYSNPSNDFTSPSGSGYDSPSSSGYSSPSGSGFGSTSGSGYGSSSGSGSNGFSGSGYNGPTASNDDFSSPGPSGYSDPTALQNQCRKIRRQRRRRRRQNKCKVYEQDECWSPGVPDLDCPNSGLCCFDGCSNKCVKSEEKPTKSQPSYGNQQSSSQPSYGNQQSSSQPSYGSQPSVKQPSFSSNQQSSYGNQQSSSQPSVKQPSFSNQQSSYGNQQSLSRPTYGSQQSSNQPSYGSQQSSNQPSYGNQQSSSQPSYGSQPSVKQPSFSNQQSSYGNQQSKYETSTPAVSSYGTLTTSKQPSFDSYGSPIDRPLPNGYQGSNQPQDFQTQSFFQPNEVEENFEYESPSTSSGGSSYQSPSTSSGGSSYQSPSAQKKKQRPLVILHIYNPDGGKNTVTAYSHKSGDLAKDINDFHVELENQGQEVDLYKEQRKKRQGTVKVSGLKCPYVSRKLPYFCKGAQNECSAPNEYDHRCNSLCCFDGCAYTCSRPNRRRSQPTRPNTESIYDALEKVNKPFCAPIPKKPKSECRLNFINHCYKDSDCHSGLYCCFDGCVKVCSEPYQAPSFARTVHDSLYNFFIPEGSS